MMKKRKGAALIYALIVFVVLFTIGMAILSLTIQNANMAQIQQEQIQAYYMVLSGVELGSGAVLAGDEEIEGLLYEYRTNPRKAAMTHTEELPQPADRVDGKIEGRAEITIRATDKFGTVEFADPEVDLDDYTADDIWVEIEVLGTSINARGQERTHAGLIRISTTDPELIVRELMSPLDYSSAP